MLRFLSKRYSTKRRKTPAAAVPAVTMEDEAAVGRQPQQLLTLAEGSNNLSAAFHHRSSTLSVKKITPRNILQCRVELLDGVNFSVQLPVSGTHNYEYCFVIWCLFNYPTFISLIERISI